MIKLQVRLAVFIDTTTTTNRLIQILYETKLVIKLYLESNSTNHALYVCLFTMFGIVHFGSGLTLKEKLNIFENILCLLAELHEKIPLC